MRYTVTDKTDKNATDKPTTKDALNGLKRTMFGMAPEDLVIIGLDTDHKDGEHVLWDPRVLEPVSEELVSAIEAAGGVLQPITVRKSAEGKAEVVFGRGRVRALRELNKKLVEKGLKPMVVNVIAKQADDKTLVSWMIIENEIRKPTTPIQKTRLLKVLIGQGFSDAECADRFGVTATSIRNWKKLFDAETSVLAAVEAGEIKSSTAGELAHLPPEKQIEELEKLRAAQEKGDGKATTEAARNVRRQETGSSRATTFKIPSKKVVMKILDTKRKPKGMSKDALNMLRWTQGLVDASAVPGLEDLLNDIESTSQLNAAQADVMNDLAKGDKPTTEYHKSTLNGLVRRGLVTLYEVGGVTFAHKADEASTSTDATANASTADASTAASTADASMADASTADANTAIDADAVMEAADSAPVASSSDMNGVEAQA